MKNVDFPMKNLRMSVPLTLPSLGLGNLKHLGHCMSVIMEKLKCKAMPTSNILNKSYARWCESIKYSYEYIILITFSINKLFLN